MSSVTLSSLLIIVVFIVPIISRVTGVCVLARVTLDVSPNLSINVRKEPMVLDCAFTVATPTEEVTQLTWSRKKSYDRKFKLIVQVTLL